jgi:hypothetical protein
MYHKVQLLPYDDERPGAWFRCEECGQVGRFTDYFEEQPCASLLVSRLCAIAFEAGMNGARPVECVDGDGTEFYTLTTWVALTKEEVE